MIHLSSIKGRRWAEDAGIVRIYRKAEADVNAYFPEPANEKSWADWEMTGEYALDHGPAEDVWWWGDFSALEKSLKNCKSERFEHLGHTVLKIVERSLLELQTELCQKWPADWKSWMEIAQELMPDHPYQESVDLGRTADWWRDVAVKLMRLGGCFLCRRPYPNHKWNCPDR